WEQKLVALRELSDRHERFLRSQPRVPDGDEREQIRRLATDLPALWAAASTTDADRKEVLRQVIEEVIVTVEGQTEWCEARIRWAGGSETRTRYRRPVSRLEQLGSAGGLRRRVAELRAEGLTAPALAARLNAEGLRASDGRPFTGPGVRRLLSR